MSLRAMSCWFYRDDLSPTDILVGIALGENVGDTDLCWPSIRLLVAKTRLGRASVQRSLAKMERMGLIKKMLRRNRSTVYVFNFEALPVLKPSRDERTAALKELGVDIAEEQPELFNDPASHRGPGGITPMRGGPHSDAPGASQGYTEDSIEESKGNNLDSGDLKSPCASLTAYVEDGWHKLKAEFPGIADIRRVDDNLAKQIELRARQHAKPGEKPEDVWSTTFEQIRTSLFLTGRVPPGQGRDAPFKLSLGWLCKTMNFREVINGKYSSERGQQGRAFDAETGRRLGPTEQAVSGTIARMRAAGQRGGRG